MSNCVWAPWGLLHSCSSYVTDQARSEIEGWSWCGGGMVMIDVMRLQRQAKDCFISAEERRGRASRLTAVFRAGWTKALFSRRLETGSGAKFWGSTPLITTTWPLTTLICQRHTAFLRSRRRGVYWNGKGKQVGEKWGQVYGKKERNNNGTGSWIKVCVTDQRGQHGSWHFLKITELQLFKTQKAPKDINLVKSPVSASAVCVSRADREAELEPTNLSYTLQSKQHHFYSRRVIMSYNGGVYIPVSYSVQPCFCIYVGPDPPRINRYVGQ